MKISSTQITQEKFYKNRRKFIKQLGLLSSTFYFAPNAISNANVSKKLTDYNYITSSNSGYIVILGLGGSFAFVAFKSRRNFCICVLVHKKRFQIYILS